jgi:general secretion pathway protein E
VNALAATVTDDAEGRILDALLARGRLKEGDLARARPLHAEGGSLLGLLVRLGLVSERDQAQASAEVLGLPLLEGKQVPEARRRRWPRLAAVAALPEAVPCVPAGWMNRGAAVAGRCPRRLSAAGRAAGAGVPVTPVLGMRAEIDDLVERWFGQAAARWARSWKPPMARAVRSTTSSTCATLPRKRR